MRLPGCLLASLVVYPATVLSAEYVLDTSFDVSNFFTEFAFFTEPDPTNGYVQYVDQDTAVSMGLAGERDGKVYLGADSIERNPSQGRKSVRLTSNRPFTHGLFLADFSHMPANVCGSWPAFWLFGPMWPSSGEIDVVEGVNNQDAATITLHTLPGCMITNRGSENSTFLKAADCNTGGASAGCGQQTAKGENYGTGFNMIGGGIYALEWNSEHVAVWFFPRATIPPDIVSSAPVPSTWGPPSARFAGGSGCNIDAFFRDNNIVFTNTFCGDWAGSPDVWGANPTCSALAPTCQQYVGNNPQLFNESYWLIDSVKVYRSFEVMTWNS